MNTDLNTLFLFPIITGVIGGILTWLFTKILERQNIFGSKSDFRGFSGVWYGTHLTADPKTGCVTQRNHEYKLNVTRSGIIKGTSKDLITSPPTNWIVRGNVFEGGLALISQETSRTDLYSTELYSFKVFAFDPRIENASLTGTLNGWNYYDRSKFVATIILSRMRIDEKEFTQALNDTSTVLYDKSLSI